MVMLELRFPGGRYHATPSGHHVNEGLVEWPPSPWRIVRALIAVGYARLEWSTVPPEAEALIEKLSSVLPEYELPSASVAHSRHYMPLAKIDKGSEATTLVYDAFADVGTGAVLVRWPVKLEDGQHGLLSSLVRGLNYLGRSESWVEGEVLDSEAAIEVNAWPCEEGQSGPGRGFEQVVTLAPEPAFGAWCAEERSSIAASHAIPKNPAGKKSKAQARAEQQRAKALDVIPLKLVEALQWDTARWREAGWARAPGARQVLYWRRRDALEVGPPVHRKSSPVRRVECMLMALATPSRNRSALPTVGRTLPQAELIHRALISHAGDGAEVDVPELTGRDAGGGALTGHGHIRVLPLDLDQDHHLDHVVLWAKDGLGEKAQHAVRALRRTYQKAGHDLQVSLIGAGELESLRGLPEAFRAEVDGLVGPRQGATIWESATPYVPPRHLKPRGRNSLEGQVGEELRSLGFPEPLRIERLRFEGDRLRLRHAILRRRAGRPQPKGGTGFIIRVVFEAPVSGPICLGYASHFGLGRLAAIKGYDP